MSRVILLCADHPLPLYAAQTDVYKRQVYEVVLSDCLNQKGLRFFYTAAQKSAALMNMGKLGILELKDQSYRDLSGGQQQRVLLARALCARCV